jgi:hypothetical protein
MQSETLKKNLLYGLTAAIVGVLIILAPLIVGAELTNAKYDLVATLKSLPKEFEELERPAAFLNMHADSSVEVRILAISFVIASAACMLFKRWTPRHDYRWFRPYP